MHRPLDQPACGFDVELTCMDWRPQPELVTDCRVDFPELPELLA